MEQLVKNLQAEIKHSLKIDVSFTKLDQLHYATQTAEPNKVTYFALKNRFGCRKVANENYNLIIKLPQ